MTDYVSDHRDRRTGRAPERDYGGRPVEGDHLLMLHLLYVRTVRKAGQVGARSGYTSLDSLREASGLPARRVWGLVDELQEKDLVNCVWDSQAPQTPSRNSAEQTADGRFLRCTQVGLTAEGLSYPPLHEYHRLQHQRRQDMRGQGQPRRETGRGQVQEPERGLPPQHGYRVYRPQVRAARRLKALVCAFVLLVLAVVAALLALFF